MTGTPDDPSITKESVHHFFKYVSGNPLVRPAWAYDVTRQGEGIVDVTTHLLDLVMWEAFPEQPIDTTDIEILSARRWPTLITPEQFERSTKLAEFPDYLRGNVDQNGILIVYANGEINYRLKGIHAKVSVIWNYEAPAGAGDTHYSIMKGSNCNIIIRQGQEQNYKPELYVEPVSGAILAELETPLKDALAALQSAWPGVGMEKQNNRFLITIPDKYRIGHEAHFGQVTERYLKYLVEGRLPSWEVPNMIAKYYTTSKALEMAKEE